VWCICERGETHTEFWCGNLKGRRHLEDVGIDGRKILKCVSGGGGGVDCINLAQDRDKWRVDANTVMNLRDA
jgi:hypothetical protein